MKKKMYVKPMIYLEKFELSKHIADCAWELTSSDDKNCMAKADPDYLGSGMANLFVSSDIGCDVTPDNYGVYCYQNGGEGANVFKS